MIRNLVTVSLIALLLLVLACGGDDDDGDASAPDAQADGDVQAQLDEIQAQLEGIRSRLDHHDTTIQQAKMLGALNTFVAEDMHGLDEAMQAASEIGAGWSARAERMLQAAQSVEWPDDLQDAAHGTEDALAAVMDALAEEDLATAKERMLEAHELWHDVEHDAYHVVAGPQSDHGHEHPDEGEETASPSS